MTDSERLQSAVATLREHFDTVQVFASREDNGTTTTFAERGAGNWFARYGQVKTFINDVEKGIIQIEVKRPDTKNEWEN